LQLSSAKNLHAKAFIGKTSRQDLELNVRSVNSINHCGQFSAQYAASGLVAVNTAASASTLVQKTFGRFGSIYGLQQTSKGKPHCFSLKFDREPTNK
jgi:hypothetical protein